MDKSKREKRSGKNIQDDLDALFALPLTEFTPARNALATRLKKAGETGDAERIKALAKPSVAAWAVNQLFWKHRIAFDRLLDAGERFRMAQTAQLTGKSADLRAPLEARRAALSELSTHAAKILADGGSAATPDTMRRVTTTLEALSTYAGIPDTPPPGRLMDDVQPPGFEALAALVPRVGSDRTGGPFDIAQGKPTRVIPFEFKPSRRAARKATDAVDEQAREAERQAQIAAARAAIQEAERTLRDARKAAQKAEEELKKAAARAKEAEAEKQKLDQQFEKLTAQADEARKNARAVAAAAEGAAQEVEDAERALEKAKRTLSSMNDD